MLAKDTILLILFTGFLWQRYWNGLPFPPPVGHVLKRQKDMTPEDEHTPPPKLEANMLLGKSQGQLLIAPERMEPKCGWAKVETTPSCGGVW